MTLSIKDIREITDFPQHASAKMVWQELIDRGWSLDIIQHDASIKLVVVEVSKGQKRFITTEKDNQFYTPLNPRQCYFFTVDKTLTGKILNRVGLSTPISHLEFDQIPSDLVNEWGHSVVVKPHASHGGKGISFVEPTGDLSEAVVKALEYSSKAIIQEKVSGNEHRVLFIGGKFAAAFRGESASVVGDGSSSTDQLIDNKNESKSRPDYSGTRSKIIKERTVSYFGQEFINEVPKAGEKVYVDVISNVSFGGDAYDVTDAVSNELIKRLESFCKLSGLSVVGVDIITSDISSDDINIHKITEINGCPGLRPHVIIENGNPQPVQILYVDALEKYAEMVYP